MNTKCEIEFQHFILLPKNKILLYSSCIVYMIATKKQWFYIQERFELWLSSMDPQMFMDMVIINNLSLHLNITKK